MDYLSWNERIASHFFRAEAAGQKVYLYVNEEVIADLGALDGVGVEDFVEAIKLGPPWVTRQGLCQKALQSLKNWRVRGGDHPPYVGYLALFVLAAGIEGDFSPIAYYPRLRSLLGDEPTSGQMPSFDNMWELWFDLETWSNQDRAGALGIFSVSFAFNKWIHIGLPVAQTLLTKTERDSLPTIFAKAGLDPISPPSDEELAVLLRTQGRDELQLRTLRLLEGVGEADDARLAVLIELILEELRDWDGTAQIEGRLGEQQSRVYGSLCLCCELDATTGWTHVTLRCRTKHDFPEDGLLLVMDGRPDHLRCEEAALGWSSRVTSDSGGTPIDASNFDWSRGLHLRDPDQEWFFSLSACPIRVFLSGAIHEIPGIVETRRLPQGSPFYLAAREDCTPLLIRWGASSCTGFRKLPITRGLPEGWSFFHADAAHSDELVKSEYPLLALPRTIRLGFEGGIRVSRGHQFFKFAPPKLVVEGGGQSIEIYCNEVKLKPSHIDSIYDLPAEALSSNEITIEARHNGDTYKKRLFLVDDFPWPIQTSTREFDSFGNVRTEMSSDIASVAGALVTGVNSPPFDFHDIPQILEERRVFYVGREPGQIISWPSEPLPTAWSPVWIIPMRQRGRAIFCGMSLSTSEPLRSRCADRRKLKEWKELLWHRRKRITVPIHLGLRRLWERFQDEARSV